VRVTVSTGASFAAGMLSGLATLSGPLHGTAAVSVHALVVRAGAIGAEAAVREILAEGRRLPAFGHPLYPDGDVRAVELLGTLELPPVHAALLEAATRIVGEAPNVDFALAALTAAHRLPPTAPFTLFALARSVGWLAHMLEQATQARLIRPRARYTGPAVRPAG
jgi:citrate synthase